MGTEKKLRLLRLESVNFKGTSFDLEMKDITKIYGKNGIGKTTVVDAYQWLITGKDSQNRKQFPIMPIDNKGNLIHHMDVLVTAVMDLNGLVFSISRGIKEKWSKPKGQIQAEMTGYESVFHWDGMPINMTQFNTNLGNILENEEVFKICSFAGYFNTFKPADQRELLINMVGVPSYTEVAGGRKEFSNLLDLLTNKTLEEYRKELSAKIRVVKKDLQAFPYKIQEARRALPEEQNWDAIRSDISKLETKVENYNNRLASLSQLVEDHNAKIRKRKSEFEEEIITVSATLRERKAVLKEIIDSAVARNKAATKKFNDETSDLQDAILHARRKLKYLEKEILEIVRKREGLIKTYTDFIGGDQLMCPYCGHEVEETEATNMAKSMAETGQEYSDLIQTYTAERDEQKALIDQNKALLKDRQLELERVPKQAEMDNDVELLKLQRKLQLAVDGKKAISLRLPPDSSRVRQKRKEYSDRLKAQIKLLATEDLFSRQKERIELLSDEQADKYKILAELERAEFIAESLAKLQIERIEAKIAEKFPNGRWKLYDLQKNGNEVEICEYSVDGIPYSGLNTAAKVNADLDICEAFSKHNELNLPVFVDNRESVTNVPYSHSQIISLIVSPEHNKLTVCHDR